MHRRHFLQFLGSGLAAAAATSPVLSFAAAPAASANYHRLLILIELKGGNDGLNTLVPYTDGSYYALRPRLAIPRDKVLQLDERAGLNPALAPLLPLWRDRRLAVLQGIGYPSPNLSHFRSIEIWDTASQPDEYLQEGWLTRAFSRTPTPKAFAADGVIVGGSELGPLAGGGTRAVALANTEQFIRQSRLADPSGEGTRNRALEHILKVEADIVQAAAGLNANYAFRTEFPNHAFGNAVRTACQVVASGREDRGQVAVVRITQGGYDTHQAQPGVHTRLLEELAGGIVALQKALVELGRWDDTLLLTYAEFGRRPKENQSLGTDHGTANVHFALGGRVKGGLYGEAPSLSRLSGDGNLLHTTDFRAVYATALERWWGLDSRELLGGRYPPLAFI